MGISTAIAPCLSILQGFSTFFDKHTGRKYTTTECILLGILEMDGSFPSFKRNLRVFYP